MFMTAVLLAFCPVRATQCRRLGISSTAVSEELAAAMHDGATSASIRNERKNPLDGFQRSAQFLTDMRGSKGPMAMTFYMYHTPGKDDKELQNVIAGDIPGMMWYLHNEVIGTAPRKHRISTIVRYKVTMRSSAKLYEERHAQFGPYVNFTSGRCTDKDCDVIWNTYGFNIGCRTVNSSANAYLSPFVTRLGGKDCPPHCNDGVWYSVPGNCPSMTFDGKTQDCNLRMPGGLCNDVHLLGKPGASCTYFVENAGEVSIDELVGINNYTEFSSVHHFKEYDWETDSGAGTDFWNRRHDPAACMVRMNKLQSLFKLHFPNLPETYGEPPCDT